jgi:hypothetical protein
MNIQGEYLQEEDILKVFTRLWKLKKTLKYNKNQKHLLLSLFKTTLECIGNYQE